MRLVGELDDRALAENFSDYLTQLGVANQVQEESRGSYTKYEIWVHSEDDLERSENLFMEFIANPGSPEYRDITRKARLVKKLEEKENRDKGQYIDVRTTMFYAGPTPLRMFTLFLILACGVVAMLSRLGDQTDALRSLFITDFLREGPLIKWMPGLVEIRNGEIWRLFTPMLIHFGFFHFLFNMMWLKDLGSMVEDRKGTLFLVVFVLIASGASNVTQFLLSHPAFGGMSGVVYALLGYIWMKGKYDPSSRLSLHFSTVFFMIAWYILGLTGLLGNIANGSHSAGLAVGIAWGYISSGGLSRLFRS